MDKNMKKIVILGGSGFIGFHVAEFLEKKGHKVTSIDIVDPQNTLENISYITCNLLDKETLKKEIKGHDIVFNFASIANIEDCAKNPEKAININILGCLNALEASKEAKAERFIQASSVYSQFNKAGIYSMTKMSSESLVKFYNEKYNLNYTIIRFGTLYGPKSGQGNTLLNYIKEAIETNTINYPGTGEELRELIHIFDVSKVSAKIIDKKYENETLMITGIHPYRIQDIFELIKEMLGEDISINYNNLKKKYHYIKTPYISHKELCKKVAQHDYIDIHQGLLDCIQSIKAHSN